MGVSARPGEDAERMIRRFTRKVRNEGILQEVYLRKAYEKPSVKRNRKHFRAVVAQKKDRNPREISRARS
jgi:ribosomal protein S21